MIQKRGLIITIFLLIGIFLFSNFVSAYGSSFDTAEELQNGVAVSSKLSSNGPSTTSIVNVVETSSDPHYYKFVALTGEKVSIIIEAKNNGPAAGKDDRWPYGGCWDNIIFRLYNSELEEKSVDSFHKEYGCEGTFTDNYEALWSGQRYAKLYGSDSGQGGGVEFDYSIKVSRKCIEGYSNTERICVNGNWTYKDIKDFETNKTIKASECPGCIFDGTCYRLGTKFTGLTGKQRYCSYQKQVSESKDQNEKCIENYECRDPYTCREGICLDMREVKDKETGKTIYAKDCETDCLVNEVCYAIGNRFNNENQTASYCSVQKKISYQKNESVLCNENYECLSNECSKGACVDTIGFIQSIVNWFKSLFGLD